MTEPSARASSGRNKQAAPKTGLGSGDYVTNELKPEWGPGRVVEMTPRGDNAFVFFRDRPGKEVIRMKQAVLRPAESDAELAALPGFVEKNGGYALERVKRVAKPKAEKAEKVTKPKGAKAAKAAKATDA